MNSEDPLKSSEHVHRLVFFLSGFDPKGAAYYHRLYQEGAALRNRLDGEQIDVSARRREGPLMNYWQVTLNDQQDPDDGPVRSRIEFMRWDDIVRRYWPRGPWPLLRDYWNVYIDGFRWGSFTHIWRASPAGWWLAMFPALVALILFVLCAGSVAAVLAWGPFRPAPALAVGIVGALLWLGLWRWLEKTLESEWLLRLYGFTHQQSLGRMPELEARVDTLARHVVEAFHAQRADEILIVGYSTGSILAVQVAARALAIDPVLGSQGTGLSLLTLGHCIPLLACMPSAEGFRDELERLADTPALVWVDHSAPADWAAFARSPPWPRAGTARLLQRSPQFHQQMAPSAYAALKRDKRALHLHYLKAPARLGGYDFFSLTAGRRPLGDHFEALRRGSWR